MQKTNRNLSTRYSIPICCLLLSLMAMEQCVDAKNLQRNVEALSPFRQLSNVLSDEQEANGRDNEHVRRPDYDVKSNDERAPLPDYLKHKSDAKQIGDLKTGAPLFGLKKTNCSNPDGPYHGADPHGRDPHNEIHDDDLPANQADKAFYPSGDPYNGSTSNSRKHPSRPYPTDYPDPD
ncbi:MAG: hypothetical protein K2X81_20035 [Candidatus Obscuribacterales bacterium]|nr:hypothetical protein [Candidatus Obscuribacterales bacterium]